MMEAEGNRDGNSVCKGEPGEAGGQKSDRSKGQRRR
jgi:hypothetical protein